jgi:hypothetical protein
MIIPRGPKNFVKKWHFFAKKVKNLRMRDSYTNSSQTKQIKSFEIFGLTKRIHETNLWKTGLRNESTIWIFRKHVYETNPRNESTKRIHDMNLSKTCLRNESTKRIHETNPRNKSLRYGFANPPAWIRKDSFHAIVLRIVRICEDSLDS